MASRRYPSVLLACLVLFACDPSAKGPAVSNDAGALAVSDAGPTLQLRVPELPPVPELADWDDNPDTEASHELGRALFHDRRLSGSGRSNCDGCHTTFLNFQDGLPQPVPDRSFPADRPLLARHTPSLLNLVYAPVFRWDGSHTDLYEVSAFPFAEPNMNLTPGIPASDVHTTDVPSAQTTLKARLTEQFPGYVQAYRKAFDVDIRAASNEELWTLTGKALAVFFRRIVSRDAPFDRYNAGDDSAMGADAVRGLALFRGKGRCISCHYGPLLSDFQYHNVSSELPRDDGTREDEGRFLVSGKQRDRGSFLTPGLRSVYETPPYFHDGSMTGLRPLIAHLTGGGARKDPLHDPVFDTIEPLSDDETKDLLAFLRALSGRRVTGLEAPASLP